MNPVWTVLQGLLGGENGPLAKLVGRIPDVNARAAAKEAFEKEAMELVAQSELGQLEINKQEAASSSVFVAGWRPAIGWICGAALAWQFVLSPILTYLIGICVAFGWIPKLPPLPVLDTSA